MAKNKELRQSFYNRPCSACSRTPSDPAHIRTYATCREDTEEGILPLCRLCHTMAGQLGWKRMSMKYPLILEALNDRGWALDERGKLLRTRPLSD